MDFITNRTIELSTLALDGLAARHKLLTANVANENTPGYKRVDLKFENQLQNILNKENEKETQRQMSTGLSYNMRSLDDLKSVSSAGVVESEYDNFKSFKPEVVTDAGISESADGNSVNIEFEMAELAKNGMKYATVAQIQEKEFRLIQDAIKGGGM